MAATMELTQGYISDIETGRTSVSYKILKQMFERWAYNPLFHMTGMGTMIVRGVDNIENNVLYDPPEPYGKSDPDLKEKISAYLEKIQYLEKVVRDKNEEIITLRTDLSNCKDKIISLLENNT